MNTTANPVDALIAARQAQIAAAERELEKLRIELTALQEAQAAVGVSMPKARRNGRHKGRRGRSLSEGWKKVLRGIGAQDDGATTDEVIASCKEAGVTVERHTVRSQITNYVRRGWLVRSDGKVRLTPEGAKMATTASGEDKNATPEGVAS